MPRGRALLRQYVATPESATPRPVRLPPMRGNATMSVPAGDVLRLVEEVDAAETPVSTASATSSLLGARPIVAPLHRRNTRTLVPSALDDHTLAALTEDADWFGEISMSDLEGMDEAPRELPRILGAAVELSVFFAGLALGLGVQAALGFIAWQVLAG